MARLGRFGSPASAPATSTDLTEWPFGLHRSNLFCGLALLLLSSSLADTGRQRIDGFAV